MLKNLFHLSDKGYKDLKKAIWASAASDIAMMLPFFVIMQLIAALLGSIFGNTAVSSGQMWMLFAFGVLAAAVYWFIYRIEYDKTYLVAYMESENARVSMAEHMRRLPMNFFGRKDISELSSNLMRDCSTVEHAISHILPQMFGHIISITLVCLMIALFDWRMAVAIYCTLPISAAIILLSRKVQRIYSRRLTESRLETSNLVQEYLEGIKVVKAFGLGGARSVKLENTYRKLQKSSIIMELIIGIFVVSAIIILQAGVGVVIFAGIYFLTEGTLSMLYFIGYIIIAVRIYAPMVVIMQLLSELFHMIVSTERMHVLYNEAEMTGDHDFTPENCGIELKNVSFAYNEDTVIDDISLKIEDSSIVAFVGPSGSGKSTLTRLIARFWDVNKGQVIFGGRDVREVDPEALMAQMSFVFQDVVLFHDSIYNNIKLGKAGASEEEVIAAAKAARCDSFIERLPDGYNSLIGENGCTLSGGERQRISIARAILKNAPVVLLDETTASLDPENETELQQALSRLVKGKTVIMIAHRLRTVAGVDKIFVLDKGRITQQGSHQELMAQGGIYANLYTIQQQALGWSL